MNAMTPSLSRKPCGIARRSWIRPKPREDSALSAMATAMTSAPATRASEVALG